MYDQYLMFHRNVINWIIHVTYLYIAGVWDRERCFLKVTAICWFHGQSHSRGQEGLGLFLEDKLYRHCINDPYDPKEKRSEEQNNNNSYICWASSVIPVVTPGLQTHTRPQNICWRVARKRYDSISWIIMQLSVCIVFGCGEHLLYDYTHLICIPGAVCNKIVNIKTVWGARKESDIEFLKHTKCQTCQKDWSVTCWRTWTASQERRPADC